jgi:dihydrofolate synthase/folylpolyglutamate synthase
MTTRPAAITRNAATPLPKQSDVVLERLTRLHPKVIDLSLGRIERLLYRLGNPERALPPVVHVAGTNGKGSVISYLRAMLEAAGQRVQVYSSPHLVRFHERIRLNRRLIDETELVALLEECEAANGVSPITFFEVTTAAAFLAFTRRPADILLLETGLGGRLDATNVIEQPLLSVITPVSIDHVQFLGETLEQIAFEKAGILKPGTPAVIGPQPAAALAVIEARAAALGVPLSRAGREWSATPNGDGFSFQGAGKARWFPRPNLNGPHQRDNAAIALAAAERLQGFGLNGEARDRGLQEADWPGRLQRLRRGPLPGRLPGDWQLWLDGGHNAAAGTALSEVLRGWSDRPCHIVFGMMNTKAVGDFLRPLAARAASFHSVTVPGEPNALTAEAAAAETRAAGIIGTRPHAGLAEALEAIAAEARGPCRILICGSLYLAGRVLAENG